MNDVPLPAQEDSFASDHTRTQHILATDFREDAGYIDLRDKARSFSPEPYGRTFIKSNLPTCMVQQDCGEEAAYRTADDDDFTVGQRVFSILARSAQMY
jgi:hypothetical protein